MRRKGWGCWSSKIRRAIMLLGDFRIYRPAILRLPVLFERIFYAEGIERNGISNSFARSMMDWVCRNFKRLIGSHCANVQHLGHSLVTLLWTFFSGCNNEGRNYQG